jgi:hypothetical protein
MEREWLARLEIQMVEGEAGRDQMAGSDQKKNSQKLPGVLFENVLPKRDQREDRRMGQE